MSNRTVVFSLILLVVNILACKNEPSTEASSTPAETSTETTTPTAEAVQAGGGSISYVSKEKILLKDNTEIAFPKEDDKTSIVFYFATPGQSREGATSLSDEGQAQGNRLASTMAQAGLTMIYVEGNAAMQMALGVAKANASEFNIFKADNASETLKLLAHNYMGKKVMVCAAAPVVTAMMSELSGKPAPTVPTSPNNNLYVVVAKAVGDGEVKMATY